MTYDNRLIRIFRAAFISRSTSAQQSWLQHLNTFAPPTLVLIIPHWVHVRVVYDSHTIVNSDPDK
jgi:hypothetical protein